MLFRILGVLSVDVTRLQDVPQLLLTSITKTWQTRQKSHSISVRSDTRISITNSELFQPGPTSSLQIPQGREKQHQGPFSRDPIATAACRVSAGAHGKPNPISPLLLFQEQLPFITFSWANPVFWQGISSPKANAINKQLVLRTQSQLSRLHSTLQNTEQNLQNSRLLTL